MYRTFAYIFCMFTRSSRYTLILYNVVDSMNYFSTLFLFSLSVGEALVLMTIRQHFVYNVCHSVHGEGVSLDRDPLDRDTPLDTDTPLDRDPILLDRDSTPLDRDTLDRIGGTHPTGKHSCWMKIVFLEMKLKSNCNKESNLNYSLTFSSLPCSYVIRTCWAEVI